MSERSFRAILIVVALVWGVFVLLPAVMDFLPRAWAMAQTVLPGQQPRVIVEVKDAGGQQVLDKVRVQIFVDQTILLAETDEKGIATFDAVPAGPARTIKAQRLEYDVYTLANITIPGRQRVTYKIPLTYSGDKRMLVAHEMGRGMVGFSLLDTASRLALSPSGEPARWDGRVVLDVKRGPYQVFLRLADRVIVLNTADGAIVREIRLYAPAIAMAVSPDGTLLYVLAARADQQTSQRNLLLIDTGTWQTRTTLQLRSDAEQATLLVGPVGQPLYLAAGTGISVFDGRTLRGLATIPTEGAVKDLVAAPDGRTLYALTSGRQPIVAFDTATNKAQPSTLDSASAASLAGGTRLAYASYVMRKWLCVLLPGTESVAMVDLQNRSVQTLKVGREPSDLVVDEGEKLYVANAGEHYISLISLNSGKLVDTIPVRSRPIRLVLPP